MYQIEFSLLESAETQTMNCSRCALALLLLFRKRLRDPPEAAAAEAAAAAGCGADIDDDAVCRGACPDRSPGSPAPDVSAASHPPPCSFVPAACCGYITLQIRRASSFHKQQEKFHHTAS